MIRRNFLQSGLRASLIFEIEGGVTIPGDKTSQSPKYNCNFLETASVSGLKTDLFTVIASGKQKYLHI